MKKLRREKTKLQHPAEGPHVSEAILNPAAARVRLDDLVEQRTIWDEACLATHGIRNK